jgi:hypothetical protein
MVMSLMIHSLAANAGKPAVALSKGKTTASLLLFRYLTHFDDCDPVNYGRSIGTDR